MLLIGPEAQRPQIVHFDRDQVTFAASAVVVTVTPQFRPGQSVTADGHRDDSPGDDASDRHSWPQQTR